MLLPFIEPCLATRPLWEIVCNDLCRNVAFPAPSEQLLQEIRAYSDDCEAKIAKNLQRLSVALMEDLLAFLQKDAWSLDGMRAKITAGSYRNSENKRRPEDVLHFYNISRYSFDEIKNNLIQLTDTSGQKFRHLSAKTLEVFLEAEPLFQEYITACAKIFDVTDEIGKILNKSIRYFYRNKKSEMLYNDPYKDPWYLAANASNGFWSRVVYSILPPPKEARQTEGPKTQELRVEKMQPVFEQPVEFDQENAEKFIRSAIKDFNKYVDKSTADNADLKESIKQQFRDNYIEYLLRGVYARYETPSRKRDELVNNIFKHAGKMPDRSEPRPLK